MSKPKKRAEVHALDRVLYLLEEGSFQSLAADSKQFARIVSALYTHVDQQRNTIVQSVEH